MTRRNWLIGIALVAVFVTLFIFAAPDLARAAAPNVPLTGGTFTVNTTTDSTTSDSYLSLREAMEIAHGGTGASGLNRALSSGEKAQLSGCAINGSNLITGGCGTGITDTIHFNVSSGATIYLVSSLPAINDTAPTIIDGGGVFPVINGSLMPSGNVFYIYSDNNTIQFLTVRNAPTTDILNTGSYNTFFSVIATNAGMYGISLSGTYNTVDTSLIGISSSVESDCTSAPSGNGSHGIFIPGGAQHNTVQSTSVGCNGGNGIEIQPSVTPGDHTLGPNNRIGTDAGAGDLGNDLYGIDVGTDWNSIHSSTIYDNQGGGIGVSSNSNNIYGNIVDYNNLEGIRIYGTAANNKIGCTADCFWSGSVIGNIIMDNFGPGLLITGTAVSNTFVMGNRVGVDGGGGAQWNTAEGILIYGSSSTYIGDGLSDVYLNWIGTQKYGDNIRLDGGASFNTIANNWIYNSSYYGVRITGGSHDNTIGGSTAIYSNTISGNTLDGVYISGNNNTVNANRITGNTSGIHIAGSSTNNVIGVNSTAQNYIYGNNADGITIDGTANHNTVGSNTIGSDPAFQVAGNAHNGVSLTSSAHDNLIGSSAGQNLIYFNGFNGILLSGSSVMNNTIGSNDIEMNTFSGVQISGGAHNNSVKPASGVLTRTNFIRLNTLNGILISLGAHDNTIDYNQISGNSHNGIELTDSNTIDNVITGTVIIGNAMDGINERTSATSNSWSHLITYQNGGLGIDKNASVDTGNIVTSPFPQITSVTRSGSMVTVSGTATPSWFGGSSTIVELYITYLDPTGFAEGKIYVGTSSAGLGDGAWSVSYPASSVGCYVAFQTVTDGITGAVTSSEFGPNSCTLNLPLIRR